MVLPSSLAQHAAVAWARQRVVVAAADGPTADAPAIAVRRPAPAIAALLLVWPGIAESDLLAALANLAATADAA